MKSAGITCYALVLMLAVLIPRQTVHHWFIHQHDASTQQSSEQASNSKCALDDIISHQGAADIVPECVKLPIPQHYVFLLPCSSEALVSNLFLFSQGRAPPVFS